MDYKKFYKEFKTVEQKALSLFKKKLKSDNPDTSFYLKLLNSKVNEDHFFLNVLDEKVVSSLGSFEKYEVEVPVESLENENTESITYDTYISSALGML